jgi:hypothetical protein
MWVYPLHIPNENQMSKVQPKSSLFFHSEACFSAAKAMRKKKKYFSYRENSEWEGQKLISL